MIGKGVSQLWSKKPKMQKAGSHIGDREAFRSQGGVVIDRGLGNPLWVVGRGIQGCGCGLPFWYPQTCNLIPQYLHTSTQLSKYCTALVK